MWRYVLPPILDALVLRFSKISMVNNEGPNDFTIERVDCLIKLAIAIPIIFIHREALGYHCVTTIFHCFLRLSWRQIGITLACHFGSARPFLLERLLPNEILVLASLVPILLGFLAVLDKAHHAEQIVVKSHEKTAHTVKLARRLGHVLDCLDLDDVLFARGHFRDKANAGSNPLSVDEAFAGPALALATAVLNELAGLNGGLAERHVGQGHGAFCFGDVAVQLVKDDGDVAFEANLFEVSGRAFLVGECGLFLPFGFVKKSCAAAGRRGRGCRSGWLSHLKGISAEWKKK